MPRPIKVFIQFDFYSGTVSSRMPPEISLKVDFPFRSSRFCRRVHVNIVVVLCILDFPVIKGCLQLFEIHPRMLHRSQFQPCSDFRQHHLLCLCRRIIPQEGFKLCFLPHPSLLQCRYIAAGKKQPQKVCKIFRQRVNKIRRGVHGTDSKDHTAESSYKAKVDTIHACPTKYRGTFRCAEVRVIIFTTFYPHRRKVNSTPQKLLKCFIHNCLPEFPFANLTAIISENTLQHKGFEIKDMLKAS